MVVDDPVVPWSLSIAIFCLLGGILVVLVTLALEQTKYKKSEEELVVDRSRQDVLLLNSTAVPGRKITEILGLVQTLYAD
jgi:hypothetical protein